jgi:orotidine-5'-phosphate decarboxylase
MERDSLIGQLREVPRQQRIITALDVSDGQEALALAQALGPAGHYVKVGLELFSAEGPAVVRALGEAGKEIFLDLKYNDIPNTVAGAARQAAHLGVSMVTIHAFAGRRALSAAAAALAEAAADRQATHPAQARPALLGVTVLTSLAAEELAEISPSPLELPDRIIRLARLAWAAGCDGLVCAAPDLEALRKELGPDPLIVTPGIRPAAAQQDDQRRVATPAAAMAGGADFLVIGRPITRAPDPASSLAAISQELSP